MSHTAVRGNTPCTFVLPGFKPEQGEHGAALIGIRAPQSVCRIGPYGKEEGIAAVITGSF